MRAHSFLTTVAWMASASSSFSFQNNPKHFKVDSHRSTASALTDKATQQWDIDRYQEQHSFVWKYGSSLVDLIDANGDDDLSILDIGCGSGELTRQIAAMEGVAQAIGMDLDPNMIDKANAQLLDDSEVSVQFQVGDIRSFRPEQPFDAVFSNAALHWVPPHDMERAVKSIASCLKPGGQLVLEMGGKGNIESIVKATQQVIPSAKSPWCFTSVGEMASLLEKNGVEISSAQLFDRPTLLEDGKEGISNWLRMFGAAFFEGMNEDEIEEALVKINEVLLSKHPEMFDGQNLTADYRRLRIVARKQE